MPTWFIDGIIYVLPILCRIWKCPFKVFFFLGADLAGEYAALLNTKKLHPTILNIKLIMSYK